MYSGYVSQSERRANHTENLNTPSKLTRALTTGEKGKFKSTDDVTKATTDETPAASSGTGGLALLKSLTKRAKASSRRTSPPKSTEEEGVASTNSDMGGPVHMDALPPPSPAVLDADGRGVPPPAPQTMEVSARTSSRLHSNATSSSGDSTGSSGSAGTKGRSHRKAPPPVTPKTRHGSSGSSHAHAPKHEKESPYMQPSKVLQIADRQQHGNGNESVSDLPPPPPPLQFSVSHLANGSSTDAGTCGCCALLNVHIAQ